PGVFLPIQNRCTEMPPGTFTDCRFGRHTWAESTCSPSPSPSGPARSVSLIPPRKVFTGSLGRPSITNCTYEPGGWLRTPSITLSPAPHSLPATCSRPGVSIHGFGAAFGASDVFAGTMAMSDTEKVELGVARPSPPPDAPPGSEEGSSAPWVGEATSV